jgi:acetyl-CoA carboxylase carboxyl transferase subunit beta
LHLTLLTSPTTGGVYASFASLADIVFAEGGATVGFAGPRVVQQLTGEVPPSDVHRSEFAFAHGFIDAIVASEDTASTIGAVLQTTVPRSAGKARHEASAEESSASAEPVRTTAGAWQSLELVRAASRLRGPQILDDLLVEGVELRGDRSGAPDDPAVVVRIGSLRDGGRTVVAIAQDASTRIEPQGFRKAIRAIELAGRLGHPVLTVIDTRGADPLPASEALGVASAIAETFEAMLACPSPTVAAICGEGGSGGALAMAVADRVVASENAVFSVIAPEGAATILYRDASRAPELAERLRIRTEDLVELGLVDVVVPEGPAGGIEAVAKPQVNVQMLSSMVSAELERLVEGRRGRRLAARHRRWRRVAQPPRRSSRGASRDRRSGR